ncbi:MAG: hypothetical protein JST83_10010 [Bacteroidetes bacterium]|nr:hypothetical protein [Bacteroidota bacterium]
MEKVTGLEITPVDEGYYDLRMATISLSKKKIQSEEKGNREISKIPLSEWPSQFENSPPLAISLTGRWVISRKIKRIENSSDQALLHAILPNAIADEFYIQRYESDTDFEFVSVIRKQALTPVLNTLRDAGISVVSLTLGPFDIHSVVPLLPQKVSTLETLPYNIEIENGYLTHIQTSPVAATAQPYDVGGIICPAGYLIAFASAFAYLTDSTTHLIDIAEVREQNSEFQYQKRFRKTGFVYLIVLFSLLLVNFIVFFYLNDDNKKIQAQVSVDATTISLVDRLHKQLSERQEFLNRNGISSTSRLCYYADRIAASVPEGITLTSLDINPATQDEDAQKLIYRSQYIHISGQTKYSIEVNDWIKAIKKWPWVAESKLTDYKQDNSGTKGAFDIELKITSDAE